ncbi:MAG TPA: bifunctional nuclease family protein [Armatimonadota bacterium]|nr:bifunctional nuclease family protein [Armatimonadota bacterium]
MLPDEMPESSGGASSEPEAPRDRSSESPGANGPGAAGANDNGQNGSTGAPHGAEGRDLTPSGKAPAPHLPEASAEGRPPARSLNEREVKVLNIFQYEERSDYTFVLLQDGRGRKLPIWIGQEQAQAIFIALRKEQYDFHRPLTHDLLKNVVEKLGGKIERLTIDDVWQDTFYARLVLILGDRTIDVDCRPSDGIALALRAQAPIYVADEVLDSCRLRDE